MREDMRLTVDDRWILRKKIWSSVKDKLPEVGELVAIRFYVPGNGDDKRHSRQEVGCLRNEEDVLKWAWVVDILDDGRALFIDEEVSHWIHLPLESEKLEATEEEMLEIIKARESEVISKKTWIMIRSLLLEHLNAKENKKCKKKEMNL